MQYHAIPCNTTYYHAIPCNTMQYLAISCNTMQYNAMPCNTMQNHASLITADGAYHCPVGSIRPFLKRDFSIWVNGSVVPIISCFRLQKIGWLVDSCKICEYLSAEADTSISSQSMILPFTEVPCIQVNMEMRTVLIMTTINFVMMNVTSYCLIANCIAMPYFSVLWMLII